MSGRSHTWVIDYLEDFPGADIPRDLIRVSIEDQNLSQVSSNIDEIGGQAQSAVDVANKIDQIHGALASQGTQILRVEQQTPITLENTSDAEIDPATVALEAALKSNHTDEFISRITDASGSEINPSTNEDQPNWLDEDIFNHDLIGTGDYTVAETSIRGTSDVVIKIESRDTETFTVTVEWTDGSGNVLFTDEPTEARDVTSANLKFDTSSDNIQLTITDTSGAAQNIIDGTINAN